MIIDVGIFQAAGAALVVKAGSMLMERLWGKNRGAVVSGLNGLDELVEVKVGRDFPLEVHQVYDFLVRQIVSACDYLSNPVVFRRVERAILALIDSGEKQKLLTELYDAAKNKAGAWISDELKAIVNKEKEMAAVEGVGKSASVSIPAGFLATRDIKEDVRAAVVVLKHTEPPTTEEINARIAESRAKLDTFMK